MSSPGPPGTPTLRIVAFNVDGSNRRFAELAPLIERLKPDILGLTELTPACLRPTARDPAARDQLARIAPDRDRIAVYEGNTAQIGSLYSPANLNKFVGPFGSFFTLELRRVRARSNQRSAPRDCVWALFCQKSH